jgi:cell division protein ZapA (FtsZ GTPase activity inhibitor)
MKTQSIEVRLLGQKIALKSAADPEITREIASLVAARLKEAESKSKGLVPHHVALLALFNLAEEYIEARGRTAERLETMDRKSRDLLALVEAELK